MDDEERRSLKKKTDVLGVKEGRGVIINLFGRYKLGHEIKCCTVLFVYIN